MVIKCAMPSKLTFKYEAADESKLSHHPKFNRVSQKKIQYMIAKFLIVQQIFLIQKQ